MPDTFDSNEPEHASFILQRLDKMKRDRQHCDFVVDIGGDEYHAHRSILAAGSDYFNAMLSHNTKESQLGKVEMIGVDSESVKACIDYIYTGKVGILDENIEGLMYVAQLMQLHKLSFAICRYVTDLLDVNTFYRTRRFAELLGIDELLSKCNKFEEDNIMTISDQCGFENERKEHIAELLASESVSLTEMEKLIVWLRWASNEPERKGPLIGFFDSINFGVIPNGYLRYILDNNPLVKDELDLYKMLNSSIMCNLELGSKDPARWSTLKFKKDTVSKFSSQSKLDLIVSVDEKEFHTRGNALCAQSGYFNEMSSPRTKKSRLEKAKKVGPAPECVKICANYILTGKAEIPVGKIERLIHVAHSLKLENLVSAIFTKIEESLNIHTFFIARRIAEFYKVESLSAKCRKYLSKYLLAIASEQSFQDEKRKFVAEILVSKKFSLTADEKLFCLLRWVGRDPAKKDDLIAALKCINLQGVSSDNLRRHLQENDKDLSLYKIFSTALLDKSGVTRRKIDINSESKYILLLDCNSDSFRYFSPITHDVKTSKKTNICKDREVSVICLGSYLYVLWKDRKVTRLKFRDRSATWERMEDMLEEHGCPPPVTSLHDSLFVIGTGRRIRGHLTAVEKFTPSENRWVRMAHRPTISVDSACLVSSGDFIYSLGGDTLPWISHSFLRFDPYVDEWTRLEPMPQGRRDGSAVSIGNKLYIMGGVKNNGFACNTMDCYDITTKQWSSLSPMIGVNGVVKTYHVNGWIFAVERYSASCHIAKYDVEKDKWYKVKMKGETAFKLCESVLV